MNEDLLIFHISDTLTDMDLSFESKEDLKFGGLLSLNFENIEVPEELQYLAGALLKVNGMLKVDFNKYKICFEKSPVFDWKEMEKEIIPIIEEMLAKNRPMIFKDRVRMVVNKRGKVSHQKVK